MVQTMMIKKESAGTGMIAQALFIDLSVYEKNQCFRILHSAKKKAYYNRYLNIDKNIVTLSIGNQLKIFLLTLYSLNWLNTAISSPE